MSTSTIAPASLGQQLKAFFGGPLPGKTNTDWLNEVKDVIKDKKCKAEFTEMLNEAGYPVLANPSAN